MRGDPLTSYAHNFATPHAWGYGLSEVEQILVDAKANGTGEPVDEERDDFDEELTQNRRGSPPAATPAPEPAAASAPSKAAPGRQNRVRAKQPQPVDGTNVRVTAFVAPSLNKRAKATFKATRHLEDDASWSEFVERAILAETQRRELEYNAGEPYPSDGTRLPAGRPLK